MICHRRGAGLPAPRSFLSHSGPLCLQLVLDAGPRDNQAMNQDPVAARARTHLRRHREGVLIADGDANTIRFVISGERGQIVFPTTPAVAESLELVLFVPDEAPQDSSELQLLLSPSRLDPERDLVIDRWRAYHGDPRLTVWLSCSIESARFEGEIVEEEPFSPPNLLAAAEPALCRLLNTDRSRLSALTEAYAGIAIREPLAVGVDDTGIDIRARFGIVRIFFPHPATTKGEAEATIQTMLEHPST